jgi:hypothetical protein
MLTPETASRPALSSAAQSFSLNRLKFLVFIFAISLAALQALAASQYVNPDGISYLDIGDELWRGNWHAVINGYWSPLYPWLLGGALWLFKPGPHRELLVVHAVNVGLFAISFVIFNFFGAAPTNIIVVCRLAGWRSHSTRKLSGPWDMQSSCRPR